MTAQLDNLMMSYPLTLSHFIERTRRIFAKKTLATRVPGVGLERMDYARWAERTQRLAGALKALGVRKGDRVGTFAWNSHRHLEVYFAAPCMGAVLHTVNIRLSAADITYIVNHAGDRALIVDESLLPLWNQVKPLVDIPTVIVSAASNPPPDGLLDYEALLARSSPAVDLEDPDERAAAAMCYTTGTTGKPKGVLYSHRSLVLHTFSLALNQCMGVSEPDTVTAVVPMFHANAWGLPFACVMVGAKIVMPGGHLDPASLVDLFQRERVTVTAGVPTIWIGVLQFLDAHPGQYDLSSIRAMYVGGSAVPQALIEAFEQRYGLRIIQAWGMTEMAPLGSVAQLPCALAGAADEEKFQYRAKQGRPAPFVEIRARGDNGLVAWDGQTMGELEVRGPWVASAYYNCPDALDRFTGDGWFRTGDIVTIDESGTIQVQDRSKDLIKSGGEWISSVALECTLMGHPAVAEAAVIPIAHPKWDERPLAAVVLKVGAEASAADLRAFLASRFPKFWLPDAFEFVDAIPRTSAGKFKKSALRERFRNYQLAE